MKKQKLSGEFMLLLAVTLNSFNLALLIKADFGVSTLSSVPLTIYYLYPEISVGTWTTIVQIISICIMISIIKKIKLGYFLSFVIAFFYGYGVDLFVNILTPFPSTMPFRIIYLLIGFIGTGLGSALFILCRLPILPFDLIVREISEECLVSIKRTRIIYDLISLGLSLILSITFLGHIQSLGLVTIFGVMFMGNITGIFVTYIQTNSEITLSTSFGRWLEKFN